MEKLKKTILQALTTEVTSSGTTIIVPDLSITYHLKFGLKQTARDIGFFDAYIEFVPPIPPIPPEPPLITYFLEDDDGDVFTDNNNNNLFIYE